MTCVTHQTSDWEMCTFTQTPDTRDDDDDTMDDGLHDNNLTCHPLYIKLCHSLWCTVWITNIKHKKVYFFFFLVYQSEN